MPQKNWIIIGVISLVFVLIGVGIFFLAGSNNTNTNTTPTPKPSAQTLPVDQTSYPQTVASDWELYSNTKYNYSIQYPPGWATIINVTPQSSQENLINATSLDIFDSAAKKSYPDGVMTIQYLSSPPQMPENLVESGDVSLGGKNAKKFAGNEQSFVRESYIISQGEGVIQIDFRYSGGDSIKGTFDAMLSSIKF